MPGASPGFSTLERRGVDTSWIELIMGVKANIKSCHRLGSAGWAEGVDEIGPLLCLAVLFIQATTLVEDSFAVEDHSANENAGIRCPDC